VTGGYDVGFCIGNIGPIPRLGFKGLCFSDGPNGVNRADLVSVFPSGIAAAAMWDRELLYQRGVAIGKEYREKGVHVMLGYVSTFLERSRGRERWNRNKDVDTDNS
jgi:beta-glucosidase